MKKTLLLLASLLSVMTSFADEVTFDFTTAANIEALGFTAPGEGAATEIGTTPIKSGDVTITPTTEGSTTTRFWQSSGTSAGTYDFRVYGGAVLTLSVPEGKTITSVVCVDNSKWTAPTPSSGAFDGKTWTGSATQLALSFTAQCRFKTITVTYTDGTGDTPEPEPEDVATEVSTLAEALALEDGTKVVIKGESSFFPIYQSGKYNYIYDANDYTTFMLAYGTMTSFVPGQTISELGGTITSYNGGKQLAVDNTLTVAGEDFAELYAEWGYTITSWEDLYVGPTQKTGLAGLSDATDLHACWYKLSGCTISGINNKNFTLLDADGNTLAGYNQFGAVDLTGLAEGDEVVVEGFMQNFKGTMEILPTKISSFASMTIAEVNAAAVGTPATLTGKIGVIAQFDDDEWYQTELWVKDVENDTYLHIQADNLLDNPLPLGTVLNEGVKGQTAETYDGSVVFNAYATSIVASDEKVTIEPTVRTISECEVNDEYVTLKGVTITKEQYMGTFISDGENRATIVSYYNFCDITGLDTTGATQYDVTGLVESAYGDVYFYPMSYTEAVADGINNVNVENNNAPVYNIAGQRVNGAQKGMFIQNGKKFIVK